MKKVRTYLIWLFAVAVLSVRFSPLCLNEAADPTVYRAGAWLLLQGKLPYVDFWDHKPPLIYVIYAVAERLGGVWGYWALEVLLFTSVLFLLAQMLQRQFGRTMAWSTSIAMLLLNRHLFLMGTFAPEQWGLMLSMAVFMLVFRKEAKYGSWLGAGILGGLAFFLKPTCILFPLSIGMVQLIRWLAGRRIADLAAAAVYAGGAIAALGAGFFLLWRVGILPAFWQACIAFNGAYAANSIASTGLQDHITNLAKACSTNGYFIMLGAVAAAGLLLKREGIKTSGFRWLFLLSVVSLAIETLFIGMTGRYYGHYFLMATLPACLCFGYAFRKVWEEAGREFGLAFASMVAMPFLAWALYWNLGQGVVLSVFARVKPVSDQMMVGLLEKAPEGKLFAWGPIPSRFYYLSGRLPASRFIYGYPLWTPSVYQKEFLAQLLSDLENDPPAVILDIMETGSLTGGDDLVDEKYYRVPASDLEPLRLFVRTHYHLMEAEGAATRIFVRNP